MPRIIPTKLMLTTVSSDPGLSGEQLERACADAAAVRAKIPTDRHSPEAAALVDPILDVGDDDDAYVSNPDDPWFVFMYAGALREHARELAVILSDIDFLQRVVACDKDALRLCALNQEIKATNHVWKKSTHTCECGALVNAEAHSHAHNVHQRDARDKIKALEAERLELVRTMFGRWNIPTCLECGE